MFIAVLLAASAVAGLALLEAVVRRTEVGAIVTLILILILELGLWDLSLRAGPLRIGPSDLLVVLLLVAATARLLRTERSAPAHRLLIALGVLVAWSVIQGAGPNGLAAAVNEARKFLVFVAVALYFSTAEIRPNLLHRIGRTWLAVAVGLCVLAAARWTAGVVGVSFWGYEDGGSLRVVPAAAALFIAQGALIAFPLLVDRSRPLLRFLAPGFIAVVVLLQHRTVWVITAAGVLYLLFRERALAPRVLTTLALAVALLAGLVFTVFADRDDEIADQLERSAQSTATFEWRMDGWVALVTDGGPDDAIEVLTGQPFGGGWARTMPNGNVVEVSPHSFYVEPYLRVGLTGVALILVTYAVALRGTLAASRRRPTADPEGPSLLEPSILHITIAVQLLYFVTYTPDPAQALLLGLGLAVAAPLTRSDRHAATDIGVHA